MIPIEAETHDGMKGKFASSQIFEIGSVPQQNDDVIAYFDDKEYAQRGSILSLFFILTIMFSKHAFSCN